MSRSRDLFLAIFLALGVLICPHSSLADYVGSSGGSPVRIRDNGTLAPPTYDTSGLFPTVETPAHNVALTPDLTKVYGLANTLGFANEVLVWNTNTGQRLNADTMFLSIPPNDNYISTADFYNNQPLIRNNELFALAPVVVPGNYPSDPPDWRIKRFDITTDALLETINPPTTQRLADVALNASGLRLYVAGTSGIYQYDKDVFSGKYNASPPVLLIPGIDGNIAFGADSRLYVRNFGNGDVERYTTFGTFIDTFISHISFPNLGTIQFGIDGNLHAYQGGSSPKILKFSGTTGSLFSTTPNSNIANGRIFFLVPEPNAGILLCIAIIAPLVQRHSRAGHRRFAKTPANRSNFRPSPKSSNS